MSTFAREGFTHMINTVPDENGAAIPPSRAFALNVWQDLLSESNKYFTVVETDGTGGTAITDAKRVILKPTLALDPLWNTDKWHIYFEVKGSAIIPNPDPSNPGTVTVQDRGFFMKIGSDTQLATIATIPSSIKEFPLVPARFWRFFADQANLLGVTVDYPRLSIKYPMAYRLTMVERGFVFASWTQVLTEDLHKMGVVCVQRGVGCDGTVSTTGQKPLYMVSNVAATGSTLGPSTGFIWTDGPFNAWFGSIVRETDDSTMQPPWQTASIGSNSTIQGFRTNTNMIMDPLEAQGNVLNYFPARWDQPVTTDTGEYILIFPFGLCSNRFAYSDEIDLLAVSKADAYQSGQSVPIGVYGETDRQYTAYNSNNQNVTPTYAGGIRVFLLTGGSTVND